MEFKITGREAKEITISVLAISFAFTVVFAGVDGLFRYPLEFFVFTILSLITIGSGFILHEMGHKLTSIYYGAYAEFKMWTNGIIFMLITSVLGLIFAAPGAVMIYSRNITRKQNAFISFAGPITNLIISIVFLMLAYLHPLIQHYTFLNGIVFYGIYHGTINVWEFGVAINLILALFNMIPIFPLDGSKIYQWNKFAWLGFTIFLLYLGSRIFSIGLVISWGIMFILFFILAGTFRFFIGKARVFKRGRRLR